MRIGIVGDIHEPFCHPMYGRFCMDVFEQWDVQRVHLIGDIVDNHAISFHESDPNGYGANDEYELAREHVSWWYELFPRATVSIGNHDALHHRRAKREGIPEPFIRSYSDVWATPKWDWQPTHVFDGVLYRHGTGSSGKDAAINQAVQRRCNVVQGHTHCWAGAKFHANDNDRVFGMNVGCGIDVASYAMAYAKDFAIRPVLGCGVVIDGHPYFEAMPCGPKEKYHRDRVGRRRWRPKR